MTGYVVYWQPGCTSCLQTKEFLRAHRIEFESVNVREDPRAMGTLAALGARSVPVVRRGAAFVFGQNLDELAAFVGIGTSRSRLPPPVLAARLIALLHAAAGLTRRIPAEALHAALPGRERTYLDLAYHVPMIVAALLDAAAGGCLSYEHFARKPPRRVRTAEEAARVTELMARSFEPWWAAHAAALPRCIETYYGTQPFAAALEQTTAHVAQHLRQLARVLELRGVPGVALEAALLEALALPADVWDSEVPLV